MLSAQIHEFKIPFKSWNNSINKSREKFRVEKTAF